MTAAIGLADPTVDRRASADAEALGRVIGDNPMHGADHRGAVRALLARIGQLEARITAQANEIAELRAVRVPRAPKV